ncbi:MAG: class I SAM-dependent methyltransferase [SAR324 cluster bacterium]|nr:class I SAM-dependent methyltransferase [SAR324 cluster bacterium]
MPSKPKVQLKDIGLDIGLAFAKHVYKTDYLHYGIWPEGLKVEPSNVLQAQTNYADLLLKNIPEGVESILDVGCGSGKFTEQLLDAGYRVEAVSPSPHLSEIVLSRIGKRAKLHQSRYEDLNLDSRFDLILFSESFQYLNLEEAFVQTRKYLNPGGFMLICDFFNREQAPEGSNPFGLDEKSPISGGHGIKRFLEIVEGQPFRKLEDQDITAETAPSLDIMRDLIQEVIRPSWNAVAYYMGSNYPKFTAFFSYFFRKKINQAHRKYFSGNTSGAQFFRFKTYRLFLYQLEPDNKIDV